MSSDSFGGALSDHQPHEPGPSKTVKALARGSACIVCRRRKLRCDGIRPSCSTCTRLKHECGYGDPGHEKLAEQITELESKVRTLEEELDGYRRAAAIAAQAVCPSTIPVHPYDYDGHQLEETAAFALIAQPTMLDSFREAILHSPASPHDELSYGTRPPSPQTQVRRPHSTLQKLQAHLQMRQFHNEDPASADSSRAASPMDGYYEDSSSDTHSFGFAPIETTDLGLSMMHPTPRHATLPFNTSMHHLHFRPELPHGHSPTGSISGWASGEGGYRLEQWSDGDAMSNSLSSSSAVSREEDRHDSFAHCPPPPVEPFSRYTFETPPDYSMQSV